MDKIWYLPPPTDEIEGDFGPYSVKELRAARSDLIKFVHESNGAIFQRVKAKCGILPDGRRKVAGSDMCSVPVDLEGAVSSDDMNGDVKHSAQDDEGASHSNKKHSVDKKIIAYTCDLCHFTTEKFHDVEEHLTFKTHFSASMCHSSKDSHGTLIPKSLLKPLVVTNRAARFKNIIPTCPECFSVYENINICNLHYQSNHDNLSDAYSLSKVQETLRPIISNGNQCLKCGKHFVKTKSLHDHWKSSDHFPIRSANKDEIRIMFCPYCERLFYDFFSCKEHIRHFHQEETGSHSFSITVLYLEKPSTIHHLLPASSPSTTKQLVNREIEMLKKMKQDAHRTDKGKQTAKNLRKNIQLYKTYSDQC